ncbi:hypothetical protein KKC1_05550 [Calderihabitans maritimus]|uniref:Uncharacterized protein n=1 Tax=Calderihabitans maritimus TaxID=1246530 RepID=A0A1Z5HPE7_9FIRM|nr:hypothetical protein KKC1_05550 [Calderihabitans maritimus]
MISVRVRTYSGVLVIQVKNRPRLEILPLIFSCQYRQKSF